MTTVRTLLAVALVIAVGGRTAAQDFPPKPGPEHEVLKKWVGTWDATVTAMGNESKGVATYKMELGGLWLTSTFEGDFGGMKFGGRGLDSYDAARKKYVGIWVDSFSTSPLVMEGTYDKEKKTQTMTGEGPGEGGKNVKFKIVTIWKDDDTVNFSMYMGDEKAPGFSIVYKRKK